MQTPWQKKRAQSATVKILNTEVCGQAMLNKLFTKQNPAFHNYERLKILPLVSMEDVDYVGQENKIVLKPLHTFALVINIFLKRGREIISEVYNFQSPEGFSVANVDKFWRWRTGRMHPFGMGGNQCELELDQRLGSNGTVRSYGNKIILDSVAVQNAKWRRVYRLPQVATLLFRTVR